MPTKKVQPGITRFEIEERKTYGYMVRICRRGEKFNQFFSDSAFGGKRKALKAAQDQYEQWVAELPAPETTKNLKSARNTTGKVGVHIAQAETDGTTYFSYCSSWVDTDGKRRKISFSWSKYGKKDAWELACLARDNETTDRKRIEQMYKAKKKIRKKK